MGIDIDGLLLTYGLPPDLERFGNFTPQLSPVFQNAELMFYKFLDYIHNNNWASMPMSCVLGSFYYQIKTLDNGESVGFRIDNRTDLESGTHVAGRFPGIDYGGSVEDLLERNLIRGDDTLVNVLYREFNGRKVVSILSLRTREDTGTWTDTNGITHQLGGGNLVQTYVWKEERNPCNALVWFTIGLGGSPEIQRWTDYANYTVPIPGYEYSQ